MDSNYLEEVRRQYEEYPYPERNPEVEKGTLLSTKSSSLDCINHYCFEGNLNHTENFRVLIAGGGTGDCTIYLAEQLRNTNAEVVYLDMSTASMAVAQERAKVRQLTNIQWVHDSILNLQSLNLGQFDYITCTGVLHHLSSPEAGLAALKSVLKKNGSIFLMLYGTYGRTAVYQMQDLMKRINQTTEDIRAKISNTKKVLNCLPDTNWFKFNKQIFNLDLASDIGIYDLLLHSQDRSYTTTELYEFVESQGLVLNTMFELESALGRMIFDPKTFLNDPQLIQEVMSLPKREQEAISELLYGQRIKHCCYISNASNKEAQFTNKDLVPIHSITSQGAVEFEDLKKQFNGNGEKIRINIAVEIFRRECTKDLFNAIDGKKSIGEIVVEVSQLNPNESLENIYSQFYKIYNALNNTGLMFLKSKNTPEYPQMVEMQSRVVSIYGRDECQKIYNKYFKK